MVAVVEKKLKPNNLVVANWVLLLLILFFQFSLTSSFPLGLANDFLSQSWEQ